MMAPLPPPPAPPPPPVNLQGPNPSNFVTKTSPSKGAVPDRNALLSEIRGGARLKKAVTNDRSQPLIDGMYYCSTLDKQLVLRFTVAVAVFHSILCFLIAQLSL